MPKLKSLIAGIAIGTGMTGALVAGGASTATAATPVTGAPVVMNDDFGDDVFDDDNNFSHFLPFLTHHNRGHKCGRGHHRGWGGGWGGWGRRHHRNDHVCIVVRNHNFNDNEDRRAERRDERKRHHWDRHNHVTG